MGNIIKKFIFMDTSNIEKYESYFKDMAAQGLYLKEVTRLFLVFERRPAGKLNFRIDASSLPSKLKFEEYKRRGFSYAGGRNCFHVFCTSEDNQGKELYLSPREQGRAFTDLEKQLSTNLIFNFIILIIISAGYYVTLMDNIYLTAAEGKLFTEIIVILLFLSILLSSIKSYFTVRKKRINLERGKWLNHQKNWERKYRKNKIKVIIWIFIGLFLIFLPSINHLINRSYALTEAKTDIPLVRLSEIEKNPDYKSQEPEKILGVDLGNSISYNYSFLAPSQFEAEESGKICTQTWQGESGIYSPNIFTKYYKLSFPKLSDGLIKDIKNKYIHDSSIKFTEVNYAPFDKVYTAKNNEEKYIFVKYKNILKYIKYFGNKEISDILPLIKENIK